MRAHVARHFEATRTALLFAIHGTGGNDPDAARSAVLAAHERRSDALHDLVGDVLYTAGGAGGQHLTSAIQQAFPGADIPDYNPDDESADNDAALSQVIDATATSRADGVQDHTHGMLSDALDATLGTDALIDALNELYDQWTGQSDTTSSDYAGMLASDWTALGWNAGQYDAAGQAVTGASGSNDGTLEITRTWRSVHSPHTRAEHAEADGQTVGLYDTFDIGGEALAYPADPSGSAAMTYNCLCYLDYNVTGPGAESVDPSALDDGAGSGDGGSDYTAKARTRRRAEFRAFREVTLG